MNTYINIYIDQTVLPDLQHTLSPLDPLNTSSEQVALRDIFAMKCRDIVAKL